MAAVSAPNPITVDLEGATDTLQRTLSDFREACKQLAAMNGHGEPIRRKIRNSLFQIRGASNGTGR